MMTVADEKQAPQAKLPQLTVVSWNLWVASTDDIESFKEAQRQIRGADPDIIVFQEIQKTSLERWAHSWTEPGELDAEGNSRWTYESLVDAVFDKTEMYPDAHKDVNKHGVLIATRLPVLEVRKLRFDKIKVSPQMRGLLALKVQTSATSQDFLWVATAHLESSSGNEKKRAVQARIVKDYLQGLEPGSLWVSDFNFDDSCEKNDTGAYTEPAQLVLDEMSSNGWRDCWRAKHFPEATSDEQAKQLRSQSNKDWGTRVDPAARKGSTKWGKRYDRALLLPSPAPPLWDVMDFKLLGEEPIDHLAGRYPSDHKGICVTLSMNTEPAKKQRKLQESRAREVSPEGFVV